MRDLEELKKEILILGSMVEEATNKAIASLVNRRPELIDEVIDGDRIIDEKELKVEDTCLKILALHQPVAGDLRFIIAVLKVNSYLERMGDLATNIAKRAKYLSHHDPLPSPFPEDLTRMAEGVKLMVRECLDALVNRDPDIARRVETRDDEVDGIHKEIYTRLTERMVADSSIIKRAVHALSASYQLERIADTATNIAQDVVFMVEGAIIRHHGLMKEAQE